MLADVVFYLCICEYFGQAMCWDKHAPSHSSACLCVPT